MVEAMDKAASASELIAAGEWTTAHAAPKKKTNATRLGFQWPSVWRCVKRVLASKWNDRAWLSRRQNGMAETDIKMAVLLQQVVPATYAFVMHTNNPLQIHVDDGSKGANEVYGEVVRGMGEVLVGNHQGRALAFVAKKQGGECKVTSLPSKRVMLQTVAGGSLICRSDSNGEDLEGFAGAGLYDSYPAAEYEETTTDYATEGMCVDAKYRTHILTQLTTIAEGVETAFDGAPQDIEGCITVNGEGKAEFYVVQARPQVL
eukprot:GDKI01006661.1.p1 GENE.GDKI01006661.1~~GDKI01006661.1.p1  ORF type:complete len:275 (+),score=109.97 GDKI01006661.1:46-825(+)